MQKETKMFNVDGVNMQFDSEAFNMFFTNIKKKKGLKVLDLELRIGDEVGVSRDAVHSWRFGQNGPVDIDIIKKLADFLGISDYKKLLRERKVNMTVQITERQRDSLKKIYDAIIDCLYEYSQAFYEKREMDENDELYSQLGKTIEKEYLVLHTLDTYSKIQEYFDELDLMFSDGYNLIGDDYGYEKMIESYSDALDKINKLLDPYFN